MLRITSCLAGGLMNCRKVNSKLADLLLDPQSVPVGVAECMSRIAPECGRELAELRVDDGFAGRLGGARSQSVLRRQTAGSVAGRASRPGRQAFWNDGRPALIYGSSLRMQPLMAGPWVSSSWLGAGHMRIFPGRQTTMPKSPRRCATCNRWTGMPKSFNNSIRSTNRPPQDDQDSGSASPSSD